MTYTLHVQFACTVRMYSNAAAAAVRCSRYIPLPRIKVAGVDRRVWIVNKMMGACSAGMADH